MSGTPLDLLKQGRRSYNRPTVKRVQLRPEEAVLGFCKSTTANGPNIGNNCKTPSSCSGSGS